MPKEHVKAKDNPYFAWPRISSVAKTYKVEPISELTAWPILGAYGEDGKYYDVAAVVDAIRKHEQDARKEHDKWLSKNA